MDKSENANKSTTIPESYAVELAAMRRRLDALERYIQFIAQKTGVNLDAIAF